MGGGLSAPVTSAYCGATSSHHFRAGFCEMLGRRQDQEDCVTFEAKLGENHPNVSVFAVFDGHYGPRTALFMANVLQERLAKLSDPFDKEQLEQLVLDLDEEYINAVRIPHGCTCVFAVVGSPAEESKKSRVVLVNCGDSRALLVNRRGEVILETRDHKPDDEIELKRIKEAGGFISMVQGIARVQGDLSVCRAIGDAKYKIPHNLPMPQRIMTSFPDVFDLTAQPGDTLILACDGLFEHFASDTISSFISSHPHLEKDPFRTVCDVVWEAIHPRVGPQSDSKDNNSAIIVHFTEPAAEPLNYYKPKHLLVGPIKRNTFSRYVNNAARYAVSVIDILRQKYPPHDLEAFEKARKEIEEFGVCQTPDRKYAAAPDTTALLTRFGYRPDGETQEPDALEVELKDAPTECFARLVGTPVPSGQRYQDMKSAFEVPSNARATEFMQTMSIKDKLTLLVELVGAISTRYACPDCRATDQSDSASTAREALVGTPHPTFTPTLHKNIFFGYLSNCSPAKEAALRAHEAADNSARILSPGQELSEDSDVEMAPAEAPPPAALVGAASAAIVVGTSAAKRRRKRKAKAKKAAAAAANADSDGEGAPGTAPSTDANEESVAGAKRKSEEDLSDRKD